MKKATTIFLSFLISLFLISSAQAAPKVVLDNKTLTFDVQPSLAKGCTLVPLRAIFEALDADVQWDGATQTVTATKDDIAISLVIDGAAYKNGQEVPLDVPAKIIDGRTMVPIRFVSESLGAIVNWNAEKNTIYIASPGSPTTVHFIDVGQGDAIYCQLPAHIDILIDAGSTNYGPTVVNYLENCKVDNLEYLIVTHPHEDHIGGLPAVYKEFEVLRTFDSGKQVDMAAYYNYYEAVLNTNNIWAQHRGNKFTFGNYTMQLLTNVESKWDDLNDYSIVCRLDIGDIEFLFMGDAGFAVEPYLSGELGAEILKVGHHGSASSTSTDFLNRVQPEVAVISVGEGNTYGHPSVSTISKLESIGAKVLRTDELGSIIIQTDGHTYSTRSELTIARPPAETTGNYVGSVKSRTYHLPSCPYRKIILLEDHIWFDTIKEAMSAGYKPCEVCKP